MLKNFVWVSDLFITLKVQMFLKILKDMWIFLFYYNRLIKYKDFYPKFSLDNCCVAKPPH